MRRGTIRGFSPYNLERRRVDSEQLRNFRLDNLAAIFVVDDERTAANFISDSPALFSLQGFFLCKVARCLRLLELTKFLLFHGSFDVALVAADGSHQFSWRNTVLPVLKQALTLSHHYSLWPAATFLLLSGFLLLSRSEYAVDCTCMLGFHSEM
jgi:hypothetical protein